VRVNAKALLMTPDLYKLNQRRPLSTFKVRIIVKFIFRAALIPVLAIGAVLVALIFWAIDRDATLKDALREAFAPLAD
jgi:hypothetical protein